MCKAIKQLSPPRGICRGWWGLDCVCGRRHDNAWHDCYLQISRHVLNHVRLIRVFFYRYWSSIYNYLYRQLLNSGRGFFRFSDYLIFLLWIDHSLVYETVYCSMKHVFLANTSSTQVVVSLSSPNIKYFQSLNLNSVTTPKLKKKNKS